VGMRRPHIAISVQLGHGHVYPTLPLCAELTKRGYRVTYATNDYYAQVVSKVGAEPVIYGTLPMPNETKKEMEEALSLSVEDPRYKKMDKSWRSYVFADTMATVSQMQRFYRENRPDLVLYDRAQLSGRILASRLNVPAVQFTAHFAYYKNLALRRDGVCENPPAIVAHASELDEFFSQQGITQSGAFWHTEALNLHFIPKEFQHNAEWFDQRFCFTGSLLERPFVPMWTKRNRGRHVILISGLSMLSDTKLNYDTFFGLFVDALAETPFHCILSIADESFNRDLPPNFELNRYASHLEILPHAALAICHGGMTSTLEALYHGVPVLMLPQTEGCREVAYRTQEMGLGVRLSGAEISPEVVKTTVMAMTEDGGLRAQVEEARRVFRSSGGAQLAVDQIERLLQI